MNVKRNHEFLFTPIVPVVFCCYYLISNYFEIKLISIVLFIVIGFFFYRLGLYLKNNYKTIYSICIVSIDWFMLDLLNLLSANQFTFLQPSILETVVKNSVALAL